MNQTTTAPKKAMPKGGKKGGAKFPRMDLETAVGYAKRLVSKTHIAPQPKDIIYSGVLDATGPRGDVKISAMKQYGFVAGDTKVGFSAADPAKRLVHAPPEELQSHFRDAVLRPKVFKGLFDTFHGDAVSRARLKQRAANLNVHPDETESCVEIYIKSAQFAGLVSPDGDSYRHAPNATTGGFSPETTDEDEGDTQSGDSDSGEKEEGAPDSATQDNGSAGAQEPKRDSNANDDRVAGDAVRPRAVISINVTLDSSLDTDKLQKQLEILKKYGAI
jgi:hypothetical protein